MTLLKAEQDINVELFLVPDENNDERQDIYHVDHSITSIPAGFHYEETEHTKNGKKFYEVVSGPWDGARFIIATETNNN